jgi:CRP-like cAMP-binding protein
MAMQDRPGPCFDFSKKQESDCAQCSLRTSGMFSNLPPEATRWATSRIENAILSRGGLVYRAGEASNAIFTLRVGVVKLVLEIPGQGTRIVRLLGRGVTLGLERLAGLPYAHTAVALRTTNLCRIPLPVIAELHACYPRLLQGLMARWNKQVSLADRWIGILGAGPVERRLIDLVQLVIDVSGDPLDAVNLPPRADVAAILGVAGESISRHMAMLKRQGLLTRVAPRTYRCSPTLFGRPPTEPEVTEGF